MMRSGHRRSIPLFIGIGSILVALAVALNIGWVVISWREGLMLAAGIIVTLIIIAGVVLNTIFLVREIRRNEQQDGFLNAVTHELKTPVASIRLYLETLQSRQVDDATRQQFYQIMLEDADRLQGTIEQVLRAGVSATTNRNRRLQPVNLYDVACECVELSRKRHQLSESALKLENRCISPALSTVWGEYDELQCAMRNLLENAVKYSGKNVDVLVTLRNEGRSRVQIRVSDHGIGISSSELKRIFKRFYRIPTPPGLRVKGTGLGLYIVSNIAKRHGGSVFAESEGAGHGSIFTLELPVIHADLLPGREAPKSALPVGKLVGDDGVSPAAPVKG
jgi:signal transduction histidine kinase